MVFWHSFKQDSPCPLLICSEENLDIIMNLFYSSQSLKKILDQFKNKRQAVCKSSNFYSNLQHSILPLSIPFLSSLQVCVSNAASKIHAQLLPLTFHSILKALGFFSFPLCQLFFHKKKKKKSTKDVFFTCLVKYVCFTSIR